MFEALQQPRHPLITDAYRAQNRELHVARPDYGANGRRWAPEVRRWRRHFGCQTVLDYGAGKCTLYHALPDLAHDWQNYDPAVAGIDDRSKVRAADLVVCLDVLEHVEPECIDDVLDDLRGLTKKAVAIFIDTKQAHKTLPDGRNAHVLQRSLGWWLPKLMERWTLVSVVNERPEFLFHGIP